MIPSWPLIGRALEFGRLSALRNDPECCGVLLAGPAGVGKTHLASSWLHARHAEGFVTERIVATRSAAVVPFAAVSPLLAALDRPGGAPNHRADLFERSAAALRARGVRQKVLLLVDDAHLLDKASAAFIHHLIAMRAAFVVLTIRVGEIAPDAIVALWKDHVVERLELSGLSQAAILELIAAVLHGPIDRADALQIAERCEGNAMFLRELILGAISDQTLVDDSGLWRLTRPISPSSRLIELLEVRLEGLSPGERELLEIIALAAPLDVTYLPVLSSMEVAESLESRGLLITAQAGNRTIVRLGQSLYYDVIGTRMPTLRRRRLAALLADTIEPSGDDPGDRLRAAIWRLESGGGTADDILAAARTAHARYDNALAERLARASVDLGGGFDSALLAATLASVLGRGTDAELQFAVLAAGARDDAERGAVALARVENLVFWMGHQTEGARIAEQAEADVVDLDRRAEIRARRAGVILAVDGPSASASLALPLLDEASGRSFVWASMPASFSLCRMGQTQRSRAVAARGRQAHESLKEPFEWERWWHDFDDVEALACAGDLIEAAQVASEHHRQSLVNGAIEERAFFGWQLSKLATDLGPIRDALYYGREAAALFRRLGREGYTRAALLPVLFASSMNSSHAAERALIDHEGIEGHTPGWLVAEQMVVHAWATLSSGDIYGGRGLLEAAAAEADHRGDLIWEATALHGLARYGRAQDVIGRLELLAGRSDSKLVALRAQSARAIATRDPDAVISTSKGFEALGATRLAADALIDAARICRKQSRPKAAASLEERSRSLLEASGFVRTCGTQGTMPGPLTDAQETTARLVAMGKSNKEIAEHLHLSVRTVENRLQRIYELFDLSSRQQLREIFSPEWPGTA